jgi:hypothetical protein
MYQLVPEDITSVLQIVKLAARVIEVSVLVQQTDVSLTHWKHGTPKISVYILRNYKQFSIQLKSIQVLKRNLCRYR